MVRWGRSFDVEDYYQIRNKHNPNLFKSVCHQTDKINIKVFFREEQLGSSKSALRQGFLSTYFYHIVLIIITILNHKRIMTKFLGISYFFVIYSHDSKHMNCSQYKGSSNKESYFDIQRKMLFCKIIDHIIKRKVSENKSFQ